MGFFFLSPISFQGWKGYRVARMQIARQKKKEKKKENETKTREGEKKEGKKGGGGFDRRYLYSCDCSRRCTGKKGGGSLQHYLVPINFQSQLKRGR